jgi:outer membrane PBP1 activator LpoA protein
MLDFLQDMLTNLKFTLNSILLTLIFTTLVASCTTTKIDTELAKVENEMVTRQSDEVTNLTSDYYLKRAKLLPVKQSIASLVSASEQFMLEEQSHKALWLANKTWALTTATFNKQIGNEKTPADNVELVADNNINNTPPKLLYRLALIKATSLQQLGYLSLAQEQLIIINKLHGDYALVHQVPYYELAKRISAEQTLPLGVIDAQLRILALKSEVLEDEVFMLWQAFSQLSSWQVKQLSIINPPNLKGWQQLLLVANELGHKPQKFNQALIQWQQENIQHLANIVIPSLRLSSATSTSSISNIAILLPLSGNQKMAGLAAQQGLLSAYQQNTNTKLHFIDENKIDMNVLNETFDNKNIDYVIGPLLKKHVELYLEQPDLVVPTLLLNLPGSYKLKYHQVALSMRREDEAVQAAASLSRKNYKHPLILASQTNVSRRIASAFSNRWQTITGQLPEIIYLESGAKMQKELKSSLEVTNSGERIKNIKRLFNQKIKSELRNRRDIDMIYLVASPAQTKLLKPYIDVNTSPFASVIPIFASSLSHSINDDRSDNRDLTDLTFTEIPWLLRSYQQDQSLVDISNSIWPQRTDSLQRIFAMGYDSLFLVNKIPLMQQSTYIRHYGQTGIIKLNSDNILTRSLIWGRYHNNKVMQIIMD